MIVENLIQWSKIEISIFVVQGKGVKYVIKNLYYNSVKINKKHEMTELGVLKTNSFKSSEIVEQDQKKGESQQVCF